MAKYAINYSGLRLKPSYDSLVHTIADQPMIVYPNRQAMQLRDSPYMTQLMNSTAVLDQQQKIQQEKLRQMAVAQAAQQGGGTRAELDAQQPQGGGGGGDGGGGARYQTPEQFALGAGETPGPESSPWADTRSQDSAPPLARVPGLPTYDTVGAPAAVVPESAWADVVGLIQPVSGFAVH